MKHFFAIMFLLLYTLVNASFLMPEEAFKPYATINKKMEISAGVTIAESIYLYEEKLKFKILGNENITIGKIKAPPAVSHDEEMVFLLSPNFSITLNKTSKAQPTEKFQLEIAYQGCSEQGLCYEPLKQTFDFEIETANLNEDQTLEPLVFEDNKATPQQATVQNKELSETDTIADLIKNESIIITLLSFFGFGFLLSLTPCVFPMIPIISGVIISHGHGLTTKKALFLSLVYVLSMATAYTIAGVLAGLFGSNLQAALQTPWVIYSFAGIFVALALSMFGLYELKAPDFIVRKASENSQHTGVIGVAVMGFFSALIVGPCVAAPLAGALVYIGQTGDAILGGLALFSLSIGMGVPLIIVGVSAGKFMPKPGMWMTMVSVIFGVMLLAVAIWMLERVLSHDVTMSLYAILGIGFSIYLGAFESGQHVFKKSVAVLLFIYSLALFLGVLSGTPSFTKPLSFLQTKNFSDAPKQKLNFIKVTSIKELDKALQDHRGNKVMLDFYADWCTSCKELEEKTFADKAVQLKLENYTLIKADVTNNSEKNRQLSKKYGIFGPPAILFFDENSNLLQSKTIIGFIEAQRFISHIDEIK